MLVYSIQYGNWVRWLFLVVSIGHKIYKYHPSYKFDPVRKRIGHSWNNQVRLQSSLDIFPIILIVWFDIRLNRPVTDIDLMMRHNIGGLRMLGMFRHFERLHWDKGLRHNIDNCFELSYQMGNQHNW